MFPFGSYRKKELLYDSNAQPVICGFSGAVISDVGCVRKNNEDNFIFGRNRNRDSVDRCKIEVSFSELSEEWHMACVFDGMGGGERGEVASNIAAEVFLDALNGLAKSQTRAEVDLLLHKAFLEANNRIISLRNEYPILGTTATVFCSNDTEFKVYHLGDSRAYLARKGELLQLTKDQTLAQMKIDAGIYREDDPLAQGDKHKLTEFIGRDRTRENLRPEESHWFSVQKGDRILLCSDGLTNLCREEGIAGIIFEASTPVEAVSRLVSAAKEKGGTDNITCIALFFL